ncbi:MAG TPA: glycosyltransferase [Salinimicrobium sp.]|nr:glycosyltransferase [Salinimicrobium sp.]
MANQGVTILITTKNRIKDLKITLEMLQPILSEAGVFCCICDDGSTDGTYELVKNEFPEIAIFKNEKSKGYLWSRNKLLQNVQTPYAISLDDDAHFLTDNPISKIIETFEANPECGLIAFRIFWGLKPPQNLQTNEKNERVRGFVGCGHAWRMSAWNDIPDYPEWFLFYGEEEFASYHLFKKSWKVIYAPEVFIQHRVNLQNRKKNKDYIERTRNSLSSGWYLYFLFLPWKIIPYKFAYSIWMQWKRKIFKGDLNAAKALLLAKRDLLRNIKNIKKERQALSISEYDQFSQLPLTKIYWNPSK